MKDLKNLKGAISLIARFDMEEDDNTIDNLICHAISQGIDIELYDEEENLLAECI